MRTALKQARTDKGLSVEELAKMLEVAPSTVYKWEDGSRAPSLDKMKEVIGILGGTVESLFFTQQLDKTSNQSIKRCLGKPPINMPHNSFGAKNSG